MTDKNKNINNTVEAYKQFIKLTMAKSMFDVGVELATADTAEIAVKLLKVLSEAVDAERSKVKKLFIEARNNLSESEKLEAVLIVSKWNEKMHKVIEET